MGFIPRTELEREVATLFDRFVADHEDEAATMSEAGGTIYAAVWDLRQDVLDAVRAGEEKAR